MPVFNDAGLTRVMVDAMRGSEARTQPFRDRVRNREFLPGAFVNLGSAITAEIMGSAGFDWLVIDLEHGAGDEGALVGQLQAVERTGATPIVRVEGLDQMRCQRALDLGAAGVLVPRLTSAEDAAKCVHHCRYSGGRGVARYTRAWRWALAEGALSRADDEVVCVVQIETASALDDVARIAATDGVDGLFVGPSDLGHSLGLQGGLANPKLVGRVRAVADAARDQGKASGIFLSSAEQAAMYREWGFSLIACSSDGGMLAREADRTATALRTPSSATVKDNER
jgi:2-keto-3-deoxy-L-rhamnonate aldolase RhmA